MQTVECRGENLLVGGMRQEISGDLPGRELIPRQVLIKCGDHPVAPRPHRPLAIDLKAVAIGIAGEIHPVGRHPLAVPRTGQQAIEEFFVGIRRRVSYERRDLGGRGGQPGNVECGPADKRGLVGLGLRRDASLLELRSHNPIDRMRWLWLAGWPGQLGKIWLRDRHERPVRLVQRSLGDPPLEQIDLFVGESADLGFRRRHHRIGIGRGDSCNQFARGNILRHDRPRAAVELTRSLLGDVEPQAGLPVATVGTVAGKTVVGEDRPNVAVERDPAAGLCPGSRFNPGGRFRWRGRHADGTKGHRHQHDRRRTADTRSKSRATHGNRFPVRVTRVADSERSSESRTDDGRSAGWRCRLNPVTPDSIVARQRTHGEFDSPSNARCPRISRLYLFSDCVS